MKKDTKLIHTSNYKGSKSPYGSVSPPVVHSSTVAFADYAQYCNPPADKVGYGRYGIEPANTFKKAMSELEGAYDTILTSSGAQAVAMTLFAILSAGDHILIADGVYQPTRDIANNVLQEFGVEITFFDALKVDNWDSLVKNNTKVVLYETPSSLTMEMPDTDLIVSFANKHNLVSVVDNTWGAGYIFNALSLGVDISIQAATKYIVGHSDTMMGTIAVRQQKLFNSIANRIKQFGVSVAPDDIYLALRGLKTLSIRMNQHHHNAMAVVNFLNSHSLIDEVFCPALSTSPGYDNWKKHCDKTNGLLSFTFKEDYGDNHIGKFIDTLELFQLGYSWGGFESLITIQSPNRSVTMWNKNRVIRLHIGLEDVDDIIADLALSLDNL